MIIESIKNRQKLNEPFLGIPLYLFVNHLLHGSSFQAFTRSIRIR